MSINLANEECFCVEEHKIERGKALNAAAMLSAYFSIIGAATLHLLENKYIFVESILNML